jgi:hypothetical protein
MKETNIQQLIRLEAHKYDITIFRNNVGKLENKAGGWVRFGLCKGSSDLIGWHNKTGKFVAIEVKKPREKLREDQKNFLDRVKASGGIAGVARKPEDIKEILLDCSLI